MALTNIEILIFLKTDLQISATAYDDFLENTITLAKAAIEREGITLQDNVEDGMLISMYAAYLYRKRKEDGPMPRMLRYALNNRLFSKDRVMAEDGKNDG